MKEESFWGTVYLKAFLIVFVYSHSMVLTGLSE